MFSFFSVSLVSIEAESVLNYGSGASCAEIG